MTSARGSHGTLLEWFEDRASTHADVVFEVCGTASTYGELGVRSSRLAAGLQALGLRPGDNICVMLPNAVETLDLWFASVKAGIIEVPINTSYRGDLLKHIIRTSEARVFVCDEDVLPSAAEAIGASGSRIEHLVVRRTGSAPAEEVDGGRLPGSVPGVTVHRLDELYTDAEPSLRRGHASDTRLILFTSGTTGPSKGVTVSNTWCFGISDRIIDVMGYTGADRLYSMFQLFHGNARYTTIMPALDVGAGFVLDTRFSASRFWDICREKEITAFNYLGAVVPILWKQPERPDDADNPVRIAFGLAAPADIWQPFEKRFGLKLVEGYGLTEVGVAICNAPGAHRMGSVGKALDGWYDIELHDEDGYRVSEGQPGEAVLRPKKPGIMFQGYYNMPDETLETFRNLWLHTGDRLRCDEDGFYYFVDRVKESMRRRGLNVSSWEVEQVVNQHEDVLESAAYGVPSELAEDEIAIAVVPREGHTIDPAKLVEHCRAGMADFAVPRYVRVVAELPKTPTERVEKYKLRADGVTPGTWDSEAAGRA